MEPHSLNFKVQTWVQFFSNENQESKPENDEEETLSLCDLATNEPNEPEPSHPEHQRSHEEDFDFGRGGTNLSENKMCSADELFFQGQILSSRLMAQTREFTRSISFPRSEPVSVVSSRSSSSRSHNSSTSGSEFTEYKPTNRNRNRNQFHSHPSPTPQIRTRSSGYSNLKSLSKWSILQLGPLKLQEIGFTDYKNRSKRSNGNGAMNDQNQKEKKKQILQFGGCKCSADVISSSMVKQMTLNEEESNVGRRKHAVSSHRTSEWLKQLSI